MEKFNTKAASEVIEILKHTDKKIVEKIPQKLIDFLFENEDKDYRPNIDFNDENWEKIQKKIHKKYQHFYIETIL